jgi:hypothetical protein
MIFWRFKGGKNIQNTNILKYFMSVIISMISENRKIFILLLINILYKWEVSLMKSRIIMILSLKILIIMSIVFLNSTPCLAAVTGEDPFFSLGTDFIILTPGNDYHHIYSFFENTHVYIDYDDNGVWDETYTLNAGDTVELTHQVSTMIKAGSGVYSDKPIEYIQYLGSRYNTVPPVQNLNDTYYWAYQNAQTLYAVVPQKEGENSIIHIDMDVDGTEDLNITVGHLERSSIDLPAQSTITLVKIWSDRPFYLYDSFTLAVPAGTDFYNPVSNAKILIVEDNTEIKIDQNNDGSYDNTSIYNKGYYYPAVPIQYGSTIHANRSIVVWDIDYGYQVPPQTMIGSDLWSIWSSKYRWGSYPNYYHSVQYYNFLTSIYDSNIKFDLVNSGNDLDPEYQNSMIHNQQYRMYSLAPEYWVNTYYYNSYHIWANKPFIEICTSNVRNFYPYSVISATTYSRQNLLDTDEIAPMEVRIFNPFANTSITNISIIIPYPDSFTTQNGNVNFDIQKRWLMNDTKIQNVTLTLVPQHIGNNYVTTLSNIDATIFNDLGSMQYYNINYEIITPSSFNNYIFEAVTISYEAPTWRLEQAI